MTKECDFPKEIGSCIWRKQVKAMGKCFQKSGKELIKYYSISIAQINDIHCRYVVFVRTIIFGNGQFNYRGIHISDDYFVHT